MTAAESILQEAPARATFSLAIPHVDGRDERDLTLSALLQSLDLEDDRKDGPEVLRAFLVHRNVSPIREWSERIWQWSVEQDSSHKLFLQDDVEVAPNFWGALEAIVEAFPKEVICFHTSSPLAPILCREDVRIATSTEGLMGVAYVLPHEVLVEFLKWRETALVDGALDELTEDTMIGIFCMCTGRRVHHPIPTIVDHNVEIASSYGNESHTGRSVTVRWDQAEQFDRAWLPEDLEVANFWRGGFKRVFDFTLDGTFLGLKRAVAIDASHEPIRHIGRHHEVTPMLARQWVKGFSTKAFHRVMADNGDRQKRQLAAAMRSRSSYRSTVRLLVCTPTRENVHPEYHTSVQQLVRLFEGDVENGFEMLHSELWSDDVVRVRNRFARKARETDATHVHFRDADNAGTPNAVIGMLRAKKAIVAAPYPTREPIDWELVEKRVRGQGDPRPIESIAAVYKIGPRDLTKGLQVDPVTACAEVLWMPLGFSLIEVATFEKMSEHFEKLCASEIDTIFADKRYTAQTLGRLTRPQLEKLAVDLAHELEDWRAGHRGLLYEDIEKQRKYPTTGLFNLICRRSEQTNELRLFGEDQSFCLRAWDLGIPVHIYLGPGSPVDHAGTAMLRGRIESFGLMRLDPQQAAAQQRKAQARVDAAALGLGADPPEDPAREPVEPAVP